MCFLHIFSYFITFTQIPHKTKNLLHFLPQIKKPLILLDLCVFLTPDSETQLSQKPLQTTKMWSYVEK